MQRLWRQWVIVVALCAVGTALGTAWYALAASHTLGESDRGAATELRQTTAIMGRGLKDDLEKALSYGIATPDIVGLESWFAENMQSNPVIKGLALSNANGALIQAHQMPQPLQSLLEKRQSSSSDRVGDYHIMTLPLRQGLDKPPVGWLHVVAGVDANHSHPMALSLAAALAVTCLMGLLLRQLRKSHIDRPLRRTREALTDLAQGRVVSLEPVEPHNPATALESALAVRLQTIIEENRQALFRTSEVRAAHFDPQILQQIDAIAAPLLERHLQANERSRSDKNARFKRKAIPLTRHMFLAGAAALIGFSVGAFALVQSNQEAALRSQLQASGNTLHQAWRGTLDQDRVRLEGVLQAVMNDSSVQTSMTALGLEQAGDSLNQALTALAPVGTVVTVTRLNGSVLASSMKPLSQARPDRVLLNFLRDGPPAAAGVWQNQGSNYRSGVARLIVTPTGERLVWLASQPLKTSLDALAGRLDAPVALANLRGQPVFEDGDAMVQAWRAEQRQGFSGKVGDEDVLLSTTLMNGLDDHELGTLMMTSRPSVQTSRRQLGLSLLATLLIVSASLVLLFYMPGLLTPVARSAKKLSALADPDPKRNGAALALNENSLQQSIDRIEDQIEAFNTLRRSRDRQGQRQARFIRQQMMQLASRLDDEARTGILADLERIELAGTAGAPAASDPKQQPGLEKDLRLEKIVDEVGILALGFQNLVSRVGDQYQQLDRLVAELREALRVKTQFIAIQQELEVARKMQLSILPRAFQTRDGLAVEATMLPAKEIGGDFYDFFAVDEHHVAMAVADVSGKGVPAALFMAVSRTLLRAVAQFSESPAKCLARLNDLLAGDNDQMMFVTLFYAVLDTRDGSVVYANAGHNPPYLLRSSGAIEVVPSTGDMALAVMDGLDYVDCTLVLSPGDGLFMFTDGVTEAFDPARAMFGEARLEHLLADLQVLPASELPNRIIAEVKAFEAGGPQTDDITCLLARYQGRA